MYFTAAGAVRRAGRMEHLIMTGWRDVAYTFLPTRLTRAVGRRVVQDVGVEGLLREREQEVFRSREGRAASDGFLFGAALPKSGGTFLFKKVSEYLGWTYRHLHDCRGRCEFDIYRPAAADSGLYRLSVHQHTLATSGNIEFLRASKANVVVTTRRLTEVVLSFRDHLLQEHKSWPFVRVPVVFDSWASARQTQFVVDYVAPWFVHFLVGWHEVRLERQLDTVLFLDHSDLVRSEQEAIRRVLNHLGVPVDEDRLGQVLSSDRGLHRVNRQRASARNTQMLPAGQSAKLEELVGFYPQKVGGCISI